MTGQEAFLAGHCRLSLVLKLDSHMSPTSAMPLFESSEEEHRQKILL